MKSIFSHEDATLNKQPTFWQRTPPLCPELCRAAVCQGLLRLRRKGQPGKVRYFILVKNLLLECKERSKEPHKHVDISWKIFDPFIETTVSGEVFGFRLGSNPVFEDFYAESQTELDRWIAHFQARCILMDLERDYTVVKSIGTGTYASVLLAEDCSTNERVAVKSVKKELLCEDEHLHMHVQEIKALRRLQHPRIVSLLRVYEDEGSIHLVIDYLTGGDLYARIVERRRYSELTAASLFRNILEVVEYIHSAGFVHRDIKPENILMAACDDDCEFKLADFGLATEIGIGGMHIKCGSPGYVAPEMLKRSTYGPQVDTFSCGVLLYLLLSGRLPFEGENSMEVLNSNKEGRIYFHQQIWSGISKEAIELVLKLTHPDPVQRLTPAEALKHSWLNKKSFSMTIRPSRVAPELSNRPGEDRISHELMMRMTARSTTEKAAPMFKVATSGQKKRCLASLKIPPVRIPGPSSPLSGEADAEEKTEAVTVKGLDSIGPGSLVKALNSPTDEGEHP